MQGNDDQEAKLTRIPDMRWYDRIVINISGGKDSQTMLRKVWKLAVEQAVTDRLVCVFADLGEEDEWAGTAGLAEYHAEFYGLRFIKVQKGDNTGSPVSLLQHIEAHGKWPDNANRFCTSDMKRDPIARIITRLCAEVREAQHFKRPVRVLNCMGLRADESPARKKLPVFKNDTRLTGKGTAKHVDVWLPIHDMTTEQVWDDIKASGVKHHWVYDAGMPRLSCRFCVLAGRKAVTRAAQIDPEGARKRAEAEDRMGHRFNRAWSMRDVIADAEAATARGEIVVATTWAC